MEQYTSFEDVSLGDLVSVRVYGHEGFQRRVGFILSKDEHPNDWDRHLYTIIIQIGDVNVPCYLNNMEDLMYNIQLVHKVPER